VKKNGCTKTRN